MGEFVWLLFSFFSLIVGSTEIWDGFLDKLISSGSIFTLLFKLHLLSIIYIFILQFLDNEGRLWSGFTWKLKGLICLSLLSESNKPNIKRTFQKSGFTELKNEKNSWNDSRISSSQQFERFWGF